MTLGLTALLLCCVGAYMLSYRKASRLMRQGEGNSPITWHALPVHFAWYAVVRTMLLALLLAILWLVSREPLIDYYLQHTLQLPEAERNGFFMMYVKRLAEGGIAGNAPALASEWAGYYRQAMLFGNIVVSVAVISLAIAGFMYAYRQIRPEIWARKKLEHWGELALKSAAYFSIAITILIFSSVVVEAVLFFQQIPLDEFLFGLQWSPQTAIREDQAGASGLFGFVPLFAGTLLITLVALMVAVPIGLFAAIYLSEYAAIRVRKIAKPALEILAGIPTVVYGFFAITTMAPLVKSLGISLGLDVASESALAAGLVMGIMLIPLISSMTDDALKAVPSALRDASLGLGATQSETITRILLPAALPGIVGGILLATSRAIGETMIVVMAAGLSANLTVNPLESVTTITVQIVALLVGDQEFGSAKTLAAFALGLTLFLFTLLLNIIALIVVRRYRQAYE